jgi:hypothetical protein
LAARLELHSDGEMRLIFDNEMQAVAEILGETGLECRDEPTSLKMFQGSFNILQFGVLTSTSWTFFLTKTPWLL